MKIEKKSLNLQIKWLNQFWARLKWEMTNLFRCRGRLSLQTEFQNVSRNLTDFNVIVKQNDAGE